MRRRLTVMLTMTTDDDSATHRPTSAAAIQVEAREHQNARPARPVEITTWSGAAQSSRAVVAPEPRRGRPRCRPRTGAARRRRRRAARAGRGPRRSPGVNGENPSPTARYPTMAGSPSRRATQPAATAASRMRPISRMGVEVASIGDGSGCGRGPGAAATSAGRRYVLVDDARVARHGTAPDRHARNRATETTATMIVEIALICGRDAELDRAVDEDRQRRRADARVERGDRRGRRTTARRRSSPPAATAGARSGRVTCRKVLTGRRPEVAGGLLQARVQLDRPGADDDRHVRDAERDVGERDLGDRAVLAAEELGRRRAAG